MKFVAKKTVTNFPKAGRDEIALLNASNRQGGKLTRNLSQFYGSAGNSAGPHYRRGYCSLEVAGVSSREKLAEKARNVTARPQVNCRGAPRDCFATGPS